MSSLALFEHYYHQLDGQGVRQVSIVLHGQFNDHEMLARTVARYLRSNAAPERVVIFGFETHESFINDAISSPSALKARLGVTWGGGAENLCFGVIQCAAPTTCRAVGIELTAKEALNVWNVSRAMIAQSIFLQSGCLQSAPRGSHYSKTSKTHCSSFIRTSNAFTESRNTLTVAYFLQQFVSQQSTRILVDTSAIASVIYAACFMAVQCGIMSSIPIIDSFRSYEGLSDADLEDMENTLFVISASTSGNLVRRAYSRGVKRQRILTLYLLSEEQVDQDTLCQLGSSHTNPDGLKLLKSWDADKCPLCKDGSVPIQIGGDLFLTSHPETASITLAKRHLPELQGNIISRFAGKGMFRAHRRIGERTAEISLDLEPLFALEESGASTSHFRDEWQRVLRRYLPANISHVVYTNYPFSRVLAEGVKSFADCYLKNKIDLVSGVDLMEARTEVNGCAVVVSPCLDDPVELMGINRDLRTKIPGGTVTYFFPFVHGVTEAQVKGVITNLTFGDRGAGTYSLHRMHELYLPDDRAPNPWDLELHCLKVLSDWIEEIGEEVPEELTLRKKLLASSTAAGLVDKLFWPDAHSKSLSIRSNFVLLPTNDGNKALDQVDVFVVISALLHNLRQVDGADGLRPNDCERRVLSPANFIRFNDGVIQSALLRAARNGELNFVSSSDRSNSARLTDHILTMIDKSQSEEGEALTEFLLAICTGVLRLEEFDLKWIVSTLLNEQNRVPKIVQLFARALDSKILPISSAGM